MAFISSQQPSHCRSHQTENISTLTVMSSDAFQPVSYLCRYLMQESCRECINGYFCGLKRPVHGLQPVQHRHFFKLRCRKNTFTISNFNDKSH